MIMKPLPTLLAALLLASATTQATLITSGTLNTTIPDGNPSGISSIINVSGLTADIRDVNVFINVSGGFNGDLYAYLTYGNGTVILLNRIGKTAGDPFGSDSAGFLVTFDGAGLTDIHGVTGGSGSQISGTYQPDGRTTDPQLVLDTDARGSSLASFNNLDGNGDWTLFFGDMAGGGGSGTSTLVSWGLEIQPVPEPINVALGVFGAVFVVFEFGRRLRKSAQGKRKFSPPMQRL